MGRGGGDYIPIATLSQPELRLHYVGSEDSHFNVS